MTLIEAWLAFLSFTSPERIEELITSYPSLKPCTKKSMRYV